MGLCIGTQLGPYEILSAIGAGGMGEVYRARDTRLDRIVAIKILPDHLSDRAELRERFEREARTIASLNHPHICTLYDIGHQDGTDFLVMEYLEGETLAERLKKGPLPLDQVLQHAIEISDALDKAHRKGITHRDLKPGNVMLTKSGTKLLDFGLAKLRGPQAAVANLSALPTEGNSITAQGAIVGTLQYMAPEQLEGKEADARTDIFAFGVVVYEMATGKKAFEGKSQASLIAKILETDPPPMSSLQPMTPPALDRVAKKCLAKEPEKRWQAASDVCDELKWIAEESTPKSAPSAVALVSSRISRRWVLVSAAACVFAAAIAALVVWALRPASAPVARPVTRTVIALPPGDRLSSLDQPALALSPDGTHLAYVAIRGGTQQLYLRAMDSPEARPISGTEGAVAPFFSPDGQWLGFFTSGKLKKISVNGGAALTLSDVAAAAVAGSWGDGGSIIFQSLVGAPLQRISEDGGTAQPLAPLEKGDVADAWPEFLPGGKAVLFTGGTITIPKITVQSIATGNRRNLTSSGAFPRFAASGHLIYAQAGTLMAVPFDSQRLEIKGAAVPVIEGVARSTDTDAAQYSISATGSLAYVSGGTEANQRRMVWVSRNGMEQPLPAPPQAYQYVRLSPDGRRVAVELENQIWLYDLARDTLTRFTFEGSNNQTPAWTPDGKRIAFYSNKEGGAPNLFWQLADGSGGLERLTTSDYTHVPRSFSPDGQLLAFHENNPKTNKDIWVLRLSDRKAEPFLRTPFIEGAPTFSPDGHWLAYVSNESGRPEVYVQPYPGPGGKWQISTESGTEPAWNRNGRELFYRSGDKMMALDVTIEPNFSVGKPHLLFERHYFTSDFPLVGTAYDISPDGQRFLMVKGVEQATAVTQINVVLNWFEELKQKVPTGKK
jgi:Tol biopolymer transport system component/predicted Ser/Thr protein kinase